MISNFTNFLIFQIFIFKFFTQSLPLYTSCLISMLLNDDMVDTKKPDGMCSPTFVMNEFSGLLSHPSILSIKHSRSA